MADNNLYKKWVLNCATGEFLGIMLAALIAVAVNLTVGEPFTLFQKILIMFSALFSGLLEGTLLSWFQWKVLKNLVPGLEFRKWWRNTTLVALGGWLLGMLPSILMAGKAGSSPATEIPLLLVGAGAIFMGLFLGSIFGWAQWLELRKHLPDTGFWIKANALGWAAGLMWIYLAATIPNEFTPVYLIIISGIIGGALAGLSVGLATGWKLR